MSIVQNKFPQSEPIMRIGIILPIDKRKKVTISFSDSSQYKIDSKSSINLTSSKLKISVDDGDVKIVKTNPEFDRHGITVHNVPAGRGFHWEKTIDVTLPGNVKISNHDGYLLLTNCVSLEQYIACVAVSEMSSACPSALLESQTITARSWILAAAEKKHLDLNLDACNDDCCQRYLGLDQMTDASQSASNDTKGIVLTYDNQICDARYSKSCGGISESAENIWAMSHTPYLSSIFDGPETDLNINWDTWFNDNPNAFCGPHFIDEKHLHTYLGNVDKEGHYFRWSVHYSQKEFCTFFSEKLKEDITKVIKIDALNRGKSGRIINLYLDYQISDGTLKTLNITNEYDIRRLLHPSFLYSSCFKINMDKSQIEFRGGGWGHGVGLCQIGALGMALNDYKTDKILLHYFKHSKLKRLY